MPSPDHGRLWTEQDFFCEDHLNFMTDGTFMALTFTSTRHVGYHSLLDTHIFVVTIGLTARLYELLFVRSDLTR